MVNTNNIAYTVGRAAATIERFAKEHFGPGTLPKLLSQPKYHIEEVFSRYVPLDYWAEFASVDFPATLIDVQQGTAWIGYYHARADLDLRAKIEAVIEQHNREADDRWDNAAALELYSFRRVTDGEGYCIALKIGKFESFVVEARIAPDGVTVDDMQFDSDYFRQEPQCIVTPEEIMNLLALVAGAIYVRLRIGSQLRALRVEQGLSTRELSERSGLVQSHIVRIENGKYNLRIDTLNTIADVLGADIKIEKK